jgi:hypothetical protein
MGKINENDLVKQLEAEKLITETLTVDENDEVIVALETKLNSSTGRLEAYVLESALFGALSFSGFLQIMATELISFSDLENFAAYIFQTAQGIIHLDNATIQAGIVGLSNKTSLFCLVSVESLICSIFFLAVIASRLRFSDIADQVRTSINLAKAYNAKEEILHDEQEMTGKKIGGRLDLLTAKVNAQLHQASIVLEEISPVMKYMEYFRNAGILVFLVILVSSSLFITSTLGWVFLVLILFTYFYFNRAAINLTFKTWFLSFRIQFVKQGYWLFALALLPQVLAYVLRIFFQVRQTDHLFSFGLLLIGLYVFAWLILAAHVDERFGEIEMDLKKQGRWKIVKNTLAVVILIFQIGLAFKYEHFTGANEMLILSTGALAWLMYFVGYYLTKTRLLGILCGIIFGSCSMGIMFKIQHWDGANVMVLIASTAFIIFIPFIVWKRKLFHWLFIRFCLVGFIFSLWYNPLLSRVSISLDMAYAHATTQVFEQVEIMSKAYSENFLKPDLKALDEIVVKTDWYINQYGTRLGFTNVYRKLSIEYWRTCREILNDSLKKNNVAFLELGLKAAQANMRIIKLFAHEEFYIEGGDFLQESDILLAMGKNEEAIQSLQNFLTENLPEKMKEAIRKRIIELRAK